MAHRPTRHAFTTLEVAAVLLVLCLVVLLLPPFMKQQWNGSGLVGSLRNVHTLLDACAQYRSVNADRVPMRACGYSQGHITGGWDTWSFAGKNCSLYWSGQVFDESAYGRPLNAYLPHTYLPVPIGYVNQGSGSTWTFNDGVPTNADRLSFQVKACKSPGDVATRQRAWPNVTPGVSCYDDVGTSYHVNMVWWSQSGWPGDFTLHYNAGTEAIRNINGQDVVRPFAWITDQTAQVVANLSPPFSIQGEFGGPNMSVMGFLTGEAEYLQVTAGAGQGAEYTFLLRP